MIFLLAFLGCLQLYTILKLLQVSYDLHVHVCPFLHEEDQEQLFEDDI